MSLRRKTRREIIVLARAAAQSGNVELARSLFREVGISYAPSGTVVIPNETIAQCAAYHRDQLSKKGLVS